MTRGFRRLCEGVCEEGGGWKNIKNTKSITVEAYKFLGGDRHEGRPTRPRKRSRGPAAVCSVYSSVLLSSSSCFALIVVRGPRRFVLTFSSFRGSLSSILLELSPTLFVSLSQQSRSVGGWCEPLSLRFISSSSSTSSSSSAPPRFIWLSIVIVGPLLVPSDAPVVDRQSRCCCWSDLVGSFIRSRLLPVKQLGDAAAGDDTSAFTVKRTKILSQTNCFLKKQTKKEQKEKKRNNPKLLTEDRQLVWILHETI